MDPRLRGDDGSRWWVRWVTSGESANAFAVGVGRVTTAGFCWRRRMLAESGGLSSRPTGAGATERNPSPSPTATVGSAGLRRVGVRGNGVNASTARRWCQKRRVATRPTGAGATERNPSPSPTATVGSARLRGVGVRGNGVRRRPGVARRKRRVVTRPTSAAWRLRRSQLAGDHCAAGASKWSPASWLLRGCGRGVVVAGLGADEDLRRSVAVGHCDCADPHPNPSPIGRGAQGWLIYSASTEHLHSAAFPSVATKREAGALKGAHRDRCATTTHPSTSALRAYAQGERGSGSEFGLLNSERPGCQPLIAGSVRRGLTVRAAAALRPGAGAGRWSFPRG